jgi:hypothetical protein
MEFSFLGYSHELTANNEYAGQGFHSEIQNIRDTANDIRPQCVLNKFCGGVAKFIRDRAQQLVMLRPIRKNITRRIGTFMGTLGLGNNEIIRPEAILTAISRTNTVGTHLSASFYLSREILENTHHTRIMYFYNVNETHAAL